MPGPNKFRMTPAEIAFQLTWAIFIATVVALWICTGPHYRIGG